MGLWLICLSHKNERESIAYSLYSSIHSKSITKMMTVTKMNNLLAKQAEEVYLLADNMGIAFPYGIACMLREGMKYGTDIFDPIAFRMIFHLILIHKCYGFIFGYISEDEMINEFSWFENFSRKFGNSGEYEPYSSYRYTRLLPQY